MEEKKVVPALTKEGLIEYDALLKQHIKDGDDAVRDDAVLNTDYLTDQEISDIIAEAEDDYYHRQ